jgi:hypothetical protein
MLAGAIQVVLEKKTLSTCSGSTKQEQQPVKWEIPAQVQQLK